MRFIFYSYYSYYFFLFTCFSCLFVFYANSTITLPLYDFPACQPSLLSYCISCWLFFSFPSFPSPEYNSVSIFSSHILLINLFISNVSIYLVSHLSPPSRIHPFYIFVFQREMVLDIQLVRSPREIQNDCYRWPTSVLWLCTWSRRTPIRISPSSNFYTFIWWMIFFIFPIVHGNFLQVSSILWLNPI